MTGQIPNNTHVYWNNNPRLVHDQGNLYCARVNLGASPDKDSPDLVPCATTVFAGKAPTSAALTYPENSTGGAEKFYPWSTYATWLHDLHLSGVAGYKTALMGKYLNRYKAPDDPMCPYPSKDGEGGTVCAPTYPSCNFDLTDDIPDSKDAVCKFNKTVSGSVYNYKDSLVDADRHALYRDGIPPGWDEWDVFAENEQQYTNYWLTENGVMNHYCTTGEAADHPDKCSDPNVNIGDEYYSTCAVQKLRFALCLAMM